MIRQVRRYNQTLNINLCIYKTTQIKNRVEYSLRYLTGDGETVIIIQELAKYGQILNMFIQ
jgi:hypothetical protein